MEQENKKDILQIITSILDIDQKLLGIDYLKEFIKNIALNLNIKYVFLGHPVDESLTQIQTDVVWAGDDYFENFIYELKDTPCELVMSGHRVCIHENNVCKNFPKDILLQEMGVEAYVGAPVVSKTPSGITSILVLLDNKPMKDKDFFSSLTDFLAKRASVEISQNYIEENLVQKVNERTLELNKANKKIFRHKQQLEDIIQTVNDFIWEVDKNGVYTYASPQVKDMLGFTPEEIIGTTPFDLMSKKEAAKIKDIFVKLLTNKEPIVQLQNINIHKDGSLVYLETSGNPIFDEDKNIIGYRGTDRDISSRVLSEIEIEKSNLKILDLNKNLEIKVKEEIKKNEKKQQIIFEQSKMAAMGEMLENIAHQWRQPLSVISIASTGLKFKSEMNIVQDGEVMSTMESINNSAQYLSQTINDFREFLKVGKDKEYFDINNTFEKTFKLLIMQFQISNIIIEKNIKDVTIYGFEHELIQVLINIFNNAKDELIKTEEKLKLISINTNINNKNLEIYIKDNAGGIPNNIINKIFESHFTTKSNYNGTGIGLYMSKIIIEKHMNGTIKASNVQFTYENVSYDGAEFKITLPLLTEKMEIL